MRIIKRRTLKEPNRISVSLTTLQSLLNEREKKNVLVPFCKFSTISICLFVFLKMADCFSHLSLVKVKVVFYRARLTLSTMAATSDV